MKTVPSHKSSRNTHFYYNDLHKHTFKTLRNLRTHVESFLIFDRVFWKYKFRNQQFLFNKNWKIVAMTGQNFLTMPKRFLESWNDDENFLIFGLFSEKISREGYRYYYRFLIKWFLIKLIQLDPYWWYCLHTAKKDNLEWTHRYTFFNKKPVYKKLSSNI